MMRRLRPSAKLVSVAFIAAAITALMIVAPACQAESAPQIDWNKVDSEALDYFRAYLRFDTTNPPSNTAAAIA